MVTQKKQKQGERANACEDNNGLGFGEEGKGEQWGVAILADNIQHRHMASDTVSSHLWQMSKNNWVGGCNSNVISLMEGEDTNHYFHLEGVQHSQGQRGHE